MNCKTITKDIIHEKGNDYNMEIKDLIDDITKFINNIVNKLIVNEFAKSVD